MRYHVVSSIGFKEWCILVIKICKDYDRMSKAAANVIAAQIITKPKSVIGLATGSTPEGAYSELIKMYDNGIISFADITTFNLDEYVGISRDNDQSYYYYMHDKLFNHIDINEKRINVPVTQGDLQLECQEYENRIKMAGGIDLQLVGIGNNGHIGFNEPSENIVDETNIIQLQEKTIIANARFFEKVEDVPTQAITMGIGTIMRAKNIVLIASGKGKAEIIRDLVKGPITPKVAASILRLHRNCTILVDEEAGSLL